MTQPLGISRRRFILAASAAAATSAAGCRSQGPSSVPALNSAELVELSAVDAVAMLTQGSVTAERYASALLTQCARAKPLNAFITLEGERVLEAARAADRRRSSGTKLGPLHGLPIPVKDSVNTRDTPPTAGPPAPP